LKYLSNKNGFLGVDNRFNFKEKVVVVPFGLEKTVSYGGGTRNGPKEIIKASHQVELYDEELNCEPYKRIGIKTLKPFKIDRNIKKALKKMSANFHPLVYLVDYIMGMIMWTLIGRVAMNIFQREDSNFFFMKVFVKLTDPLINSFRVITPSFINGVIKDVKFLA